MHNIYDEFNITVVSKTIKNKKQKLLHIAISIFPVIVIFAPMVVQLTLHALVHRVNKYTCIEFKA